MTERLTTHDHSSIFDIAEKSNNGVSAEKKQPSGTYIVTSSDGNCAAIAKYIANDICKWPNYDESTCKAVDEGGNWEKNSDKQKMQCDVLCNSEICLGTGPKEGDKIKYDCGSNGYDQLGTSCKKGGGRKPDPDKKKGICSKENRKQSWSGLSPVDGLCKEEKCTTTSCDNCYNLYSNKSGHPCTGQDGSSTCIAYDNKYVTKWLDEKCGPD